MIRGGDGGAAELKLYMSKAGDALKRLHPKMSEVEKERSE